MSHLFMFIGLVCLSIAGGDRYDNSQHGNGENVVVDLEDVLVIAIRDLESYDTDYYDYSDLTVKPEEDNYPPTTPTASQTPLLSSTTPKEQSTTQVSLSTEASLTSNVTEHAEEIKPVESAVSSSGPPHPLNTQNMQIPVVVVTDHHKKKGYVSSSSIRKKNGNSNAPALDLESLPKRTCSPGFVLDDKNRCKRAKKPLLAKHRPPLPYGLHFAQRPDANETAAKTSDL